MSATTYPLKIEIWGEDGEELLSRGHHDPTAFLAAVVRHLKADGMETRTDRRAWLTCGRLDCAGYWNRVERPIDWSDPAMLVGCTRIVKVVHQWRRWLPPHKPCGCEWDDLRYSRIVDGPGRGVFPVTAVRGG